MQDDDNTFLPPPLSAYGLALLSDKSVTPNSKMSLSSMELDDNPALRANLKNAFSVHFKDLPQTQNDPHNRSTSSQTHSIHDVSGTNMSSHNISSNNGNANVSGNVSGHSFSSLNMHSEENDDLMDVHNDPSAKSLHTNATTPSGQLASTFLNRQLSSFAKKSRFARRFAKLGPPKRASEISPVKTESLSSPSEQGADQQKPNKPQELSNAFSTPPLLQLKLQAHKNSPRRVLSNDSTFFKSLEKLREKSAEGLQFSPPFVNSLSANLLVRSQGSNTPPKSASFQVYADRKTFSRPNSRGLSQRPWSRRPLSDVSPSKLNAEKDEDIFRKPKLPRLSNSVDPVPPPTEIKAIQPTPASFPRNISNHADFPSNHFTKTNHTSGGMADDGKRKKIIFVNDSQYEKLELIGRGGTSKVYKVRSLSSKKTYAIKKVTFDQFDDACVKGFKGEIDLLHKLRNEPRVVQLHEYAINDGNIFLTMECGELDLAHVLQQRQAMSASLDLSFVRFHATEVLKCVEAVHRAGIVHSDLKPANFLFVRGMMKIIDFGIANAVPDHTANIYRESQIGTPNYMAPEALVEVNNTLNMAKGNKGNTWKVGKPSDIWSCGCIIYQMLYGRPPYASYAGQQRIMAIMNPQVKVHYPSLGLGDIPVPQSAIELMQKCLVRNPHERWNVQQCLSSDFLKPKAVSTGFVKDVVRSAVNYGYNRRHHGEISDETLDRLVHGIIHQIEDFNYA